MGSEVAMHLQDTATFCSTHCSPRTLLVLSRTQCPSHIQTNRAGTSQRCPQGLQEPKLLVEKVGQTPHIPATSDRWL